MKLIFLTFVLTIASSTLWAAPQDNANPRILKEPIQEVEDPLLSEAIQDHSRNLHHFVSVNAAWLGGQVTKKLDSGSQTAFGLSYSHRIDADKLWDVQGHWLSGRAAWLQVGEKFLIDEASYSIPFEPYYRLGLSHFADPDEAIAGLFRIDSFKASVGLGFLDIGNFGRLWTADVGAHWGMAGLAFHVQTGLQWNF